MVVAVCLVYACALCISSCFLGFVMCQYQKWGSSGVNWNFFIFGSWLNLAGRGLFMIVLIESVYAHSRTRAVHLCLFRW